MFRVDKKDLEFLKMSQRKLHFQKFVDYQGNQVDGLLNATLLTFDVVDLDGDVFEAGCCDAWLKTDDASEIPMFWSHMRSEVIGKWTNLRVDADTLKADGELFEGVSRANDAVNLITRESVKETSVGFDCTKYGITEDDDRPYGWGFDFREVQLLEASVVIWGAVPGAEIHSMKSDDIRGPDGEFNLRVIERKLIKGGCSRKQASEFMNAYRRSSDPAGKGVSDSTLAFLTNVNKLLENNQNGTRSTGEHPR